MHKEILSGIAIALTIFALLPYIRSILQGKTKPHVFSWIIWGTTTFVVFFAQLAAKGGVGAWPIGVSGCITLYIAFLAYRRKSDISITSADWGFFLFALASLPVWYFTANPLWAVVILTVVDLMGFGPTIRKAYFHPFDESPLFFLMFVVRNCIVIMALENHSVTTVLFPAAIAAACLLLIFMILYRRQVLTQKSH